MPKNEYYGRLGLAPTAGLWPRGASRFDEATKKEEKFINVWDTAAQHGCALAGSRATGCL